MGQYTGRLKEIVFIAYSPASKAMAEIPVAHYEYDKLGRLRDEWDPRVTPAPLKTIYGYDAEGHVTALTPPGQETWAFIYGTAGTDSNLGRIVKVFRAPAAETRWGGSAPVLKTQPKISGTSFVGDRLGVTHGSWKNGAFVYGYQWESCNPAGKQCTPISGATNPNYTVAATDLGHTLAVVVTATNGGGSATFRPVANVIHEPPAEYPVAAGSGPNAIALGPDGNMWFTEEWANNKVGKITNAGVVTEYSLPAGDANARGIVSGPDGNLWLAASNGLVKVTPAGVATSYNQKRAYDLVVGPDGNLWFTEYEAIGKMTPSGATTIYPLPTNSGAFGITVGPDGNLWFTDNETSRFGKITTAGVVTEYGLPAGSRPGRITAGSDGNLWFGENGTNELVRATTAGSVTEVTGGAPSDLATGPDENLWMTFPAASLVWNYPLVFGLGEKITTPTGSYPWGIGVGTNATIWYTDEETSKIARVPTSGYAEVKKTGTAYHEEPGWTIEYNVPLSGIGLPTLTESGVEKWGQKDDPVFATAIFPPDEEQRWPASSYKRASIYYLDAKGRTVNVEKPGGGISTSEYNEQNDTVRSLTADNRAAALAEGAKSVEASKLLDTESTYNAEGTELQSTLGPQHPVRLVHGKTKENEEVQARDHTVYSYDEGAPGGGPYRLVTKVTQGAQVNGEADRDVRTTSTSYGGQSGVGWKLRAPTSVTGGAKQTHTTLYDESTGDVTETRTPASTGEGSTHDTKVIYYTAAKDESYPTCGEKPQWANLPCESLPGKQPEPPLPVVTDTYNMWGEPEVATSTAGAATRTTTNSYDAAGRVLVSETLGSEGKTLPKVTNTYNTETGALEKQSASIKGETKTITTTANRLGQIVKYTDAGGVTSEFEYEPENDARLVHASDGKGSQAYSYDETTGALSKVIDTQGTNVLSFTGTYDGEGNLASEGYPNGMTAKFTRNASGEATGLIWRGVCQVAALIGRGRGGGRHGGGRGGSRGATS
ncbi:MAG TPA: hypothetical protein VK707_03280 [Solirubrobacteraceae bacterium]|nr:hypothetical protein [Solirubrobacteraceae bacterium]